MPIERETFEAAVHAHHKVVHRAARAVVRCEAEASDVVQQVFLRAFRGDVDLRGGAADVQRRLRWLAHRLALNSLRAARRRHRHELENALMAENPGPDSSADARDDAAAVRASIEDLDDVHRTTVLLRYQEDLTLAAIGELLGCAESTVHSRLQKAMELLRRRLCASGFAAAAVRLDELLPATATSPAVAPTELARNLLQIPACAVSSLTASAVSVVVAMLALVGVAVAMSGYSPDPLAAPSSSAAAAAPAATGASPGVERSEPRSETPRRAVREQDPIQAPARADAAPPPFPMLAPAVVSGTIASTNGDPIEGAIVGAICFALSSKGQTFEVTAATNAQGAYELSLPMPTPAGLSYRLTLRRADFAGEFAAKDLHLLPAEVRRGVDAAMRRWAADRPGPWTTSALVTDGAGRPVARASVQVFRRMLDAEGRERLVRECGETTDAGGRAALVGDHVGDKQVKVAAFGQPFSPLSTVLAIADAAPPALLLQLSPDVPLEVRVTEARTGAPLAGVPVTAERNDLTLAVGSSDVDGRMQLRGIDGGPVTLTGGGGAWSRFRCGDVRAGQGVVSLLCKAKVDPEDLGMHGSEIHGRVVDAATGM
ncbi:MAG: sigma-70 family RNA polymerase sigma factor, partial [Planctomycetota bacterium]